MTFSLDYVAPLDKNEFMSVYKDMKVSEQRALKKKIDARLNYVFRKAMQILEQDVSWYDYDNCGEDDSSPGFFDETFYTDYIDILGKFDNDLRAGIDMSAIPIKWMYSEFETELHEKYDNWKKKVQSEKKAKADKVSKDKAAKVDRDKRRKSVVAAIRSKLTADELSFIKFI